ncbi:MAG: haloalkane dehalogenase [Burkholderiales bacterium]
MTTSSTLRTPDERFAALPDWPYPPQYHEDLPGFARLRAHYVDVGSRPDAPVFLCLHGQPTWAYLYRRMIPIFAASGARVIAPDLFGFGRSDKPADETFYTFDMHRRMLIAFIETLDLRNITLVVQDWGGLLGLTLPLAAPSRFTRLLAMNTMLGTGDAPLSGGFIAWRAWANANPDLPVGKLMRRTCPHFTDAEVAAYEAPFPDTHYRRGYGGFRIWCRSTRKTPARRSLDKHVIGGATIGAARPSWRSVRPTRCLGRRSCANSRSRFAAVRSLTCCLTPATLRRSGAPRSPSALSERSRQVLSLGML